MIRKRALEAFDLPTVEAYRVWRDAITASMRAESAIDAAVTPTSKELAVGRWMRAKQAVFRARADFQELVEADAKERA